MNYHEDKQNAKYCGFRHYEIESVCYIVGSVISDNAKEDAITKINRLLKNDLIFWGYYFSLF